MNPFFWEEHGEILRRGQSPVAGLAAELASCTNGILGRPAPDSSAVLPDVHADRHAVSICQLQRLGCDLFALGRVALLVQKLEIPAAMRSAVNPGDDVIDRGAARRVGQVIPAPRAAPVLQLHQFRHECQAVRCPRHNLVVMLPVTSPDAKRPAAEPLIGRHRQPAHTTPASLRRHEAKLTGPSDTAAVARLRAALEFEVPVPSGRRAFGIGHSVSGVRAAPLLEVVTDVQRRGSTGSDSSARTAKTAWCTFHRGARSTNPLSACRPRPCSRRASCRFLPR
jgi:hypothetical protein